MRLSINKEDPGYSVEAYKKVKVLCDGEELSQIFTADEELGIAYGYKLDDKGKLVTQGGYLVTCSYNGDIKIIIEEGEHAC